MESGNQCLVTGCKNIVIARGMCDTHYCRWKRHGHVEHTRPGDWGDRTNHPLYKTWNWLMRSRLAEMSEPWRDFWTFVRDIGDSRPSIRHRLTQKDGAKQFGPQNFYWAMPRVSTKSPEAKAQASLHAKEWRMANIAKVQDMYLRRHYGISLPQYEEMLERQGGVCAICKQPESVRLRGKHPRRFAVDHCHKTEKVRGLLCTTCNKGIGHLKDDPAVVRAALEYLERYSAEREPETASVHGGSIS